MSGKILVRGISEQILTALNLLATNHDRSLEAEARQAIRAWVEPVFLAEERNQRCDEIGKRLSHLINTINDGRRGSRLRPCHVAQAIGEIKAGHVDNWFLGKEEPSFTQLEAIATRYGANPDWLKFGDQTVYSLNYKRLPDQADLAVKWLVNWEGEGEPETDKLEELYLVRATDQSGSFAIVKKTHDGRCQIWTTPYHISEEIGAGGEGMLISLWGTLELLYKHYTKSDCWVFGYLISPADFKLLVSGAVHPLSILSDHAKSTWWEDIWHEEMFQKNDYWPGWKSLCLRIDGAIKYRKSLSTPSTEETSEIAN